MRHEAVRLRLREGTLRVVLSLATPPLLLLFAAGFWALDASPLAVFVLAGLAAVLGYVALFDFPIAIDIGEEGIQRICVLRRQMIPWARVDSITRTRRRGLLVVTTDQKRHVLIDRDMSEGELDLLRSQARLRDVRTSF